MKECTIYSIFINNIAGYNNYFGVEENGVMKELVTGKIVYEANPNSMPPMPGLSYSKKFHVPIISVRDTLTKFLNCTDESFIKYISVLNEAEKKGVKEYEEYIESMNKIEAIQNRTKEIIRKMNGEI